MIQNYEDFMPGVFIGFIIGMFCTLLIVALSSETTDDEDNKPNRCNCIYAVEPEVQKWNRD